MSQTQPDIGNWLENIDDGTLFEVVAIDDVERTVEVQHLDGTLDEFDLDQWHSLPLVAAAPPEDANIAYGLAVIEQNPHAGDNSTLDSGNPFDSLDALEGESFAGTDESPF